MTSSLPSDQRGEDVLLSVASRHSGSRSTIAICGELDMTSTASLKDEADKILALGAAALEIDATQLRFIDSSGLIALLAIRSDATRAGTTFEVTGASAQFIRVVDLAGVGDLLLPSD